MKALLLFFPALAFASQFGTGQFGFTINDSYGPERVLPGYDYKYLVRPHATFPITCTPSTGAGDFGTCTASGPLSIAPGGSQAVDLTFRSTGNLPGKTTCDNGYQPLATTMAVQSSPGSGNIFAYTVLAFDSVGKIIGHPGTASPVWGTVSAGNPLSFTFGRIVGADNYKIYGTGNNVGYHSTIVDTGAATYTFTDRIGSTGVTGGLNAVPICGISDQWVQYYIPSYKVINLVGQTFQLQAIMPDCCSEGQTVTIADAGTGTLTALSYGDSTIALPSRYLVGGNGGFPAGTTWKVYKDMCNGSLADVDVYPWDTACILVHYPANSAPGIYRIGWNFCPSKVDLVTNCSQYFLDVEIVATPKYVFTPPTSVPKLPDCYGATDISKCSSIEGGVPHAASSHLMELYRNYPTRDYSANPDNEATAGYMVKRMCTNPPAPVDSYCYGQETQNCSGWYYDGLKNMTMMSAWVGDKNLLNCARNIANQWAFSNNWTSQPQRTYADGIVASFNTYNGGYFAPNPPFSWSAGGGTITSATVGAANDSTAPLTLTMSTPHTLTQNMVLVVSGNPAVNGTYQIASLPSATTVVLHVPKTTPSGAVTGLSVSTAPDSFHFNPRMHAALQNMIKISNLDTATNVAVGNPRMNALLMILALTTKSDLGYEYVCSHCGTKAALGPGYVPVVKDAWTAIASSLIQIMQPMPANADAIFNVGPHGYQSYQLGQVAQALIRHYESNPNTLDIWLIEQIVNEWKTGYDFTLHSPYWSPYEESFGSPPYSQGWTCIGGGPAGPHMGYDTRTMIFAWGNGNGNCGTKTAGGLNSMHMLAMAWWWAHFNDPLALTIADDMFQTGTTNFNGTAPPKLYNQTTIMFPEFRKYRELRF